MVGYNNNLVEVIRAKFPGNKDIQRVNYSTILLAYTAMCVCYPCTEQGALDWEKYPPLMKQVNRDKAWEEFKKLPMPSKRDVA